MVHHDDIVTRASLYNVKVMGILGALAGRVQYRQQVAILLVAVGLPVVKTCVQPRFHADALVQQLVGGLRLRF